MNKQDLIDNFKKARETGSGYVFVLIELPDCKEPELIINGKENFDSKEKYYLETYDDNLIHKYSPEIKIKGLSYGEIEEIYNLSI